MHLYQPTEGSSLRTDLVHFENHGPQGSEDQWGILPERLGPPLGSPVELVDRGEWLMVDTTRSCSHRSSPTAPPPASLKGGAKDKPL